MTATLTRSTTTAAAARTRPHPVPSMLRYASLDFERNLRMPEAVFFVLVLPTALYLMFTSMSQFTDEPVGHGNVAAWTMTSMALYGAVLATSNIAGAAAVERAKGWDRTLALTPSPAWSYVASKVLVGLVMAILPVALVMGVGKWTGAEMAGMRWLATAVIVVLGSTMFACYGLAAGLLFRSETAVGVATGLLVVLSFFGNLFIPLSGVMLEIARFTPLYGLAGLARWPQVEGSMAAFGPGVPSDRLWVLIVNFTVWTVVFVAVAFVAARRNTSRA